MALTEKQQEKVQVCENNVVRRIVGVKEDVKRRMCEVKKCDKKKKLMKNRLKCHVKSLGDEKVAKEQIPRKWRKKTR